MDINILRSIATVVCFALFLGVIWWAYRGKNQEGFREASMLPFALDDVDGKTKTATGGTQA